MKLVYSIVATPDPLNPNEQPAGNIIVDDRLYGHDIFGIGIQYSGVTPDLLSKPTFSNTLEIPDTSWVVGNKITVQTVKSCNCIN